MTNEEIEEMAELSGLYLYKTNEELIYCLTYFANLIAQKEREECAEICDGFYLSWIDIQGRYEFMGEGASECAGAIRARGQE